MNEVSTVRSVMLLIDITKIKAKLGLYRVCKASVCQLTLFITAGSSVWSSIPWKKLTWLDLSIFLLNFSTLNFNNINYMKTQAHS